MSEVERSYSRRGRGGATGGSLPQQGSFLFTRAVILLVVGSIIFAFWISRDTHDIEVFIERDPNSLFVVQELLQNRERFFASPVWNGLSDSAKSNSVATVLATPLSVPEWVSRNVIGRYALVTTQHETRSDQAVYMTKMSRVGTVLERVLRPTRVTRSEKSGGLRLRVLSEAGLFYAVRGRVLLVSASRRALIHTLTLSDDERLPEGEWDDSVWNLGPDLVRGHVTLSPDSRWSDYFGSIAFAFELNDTEGALRIRVRPNENLYSKLVPQLRGKEATKLIRPLPGALTLSTDLGISYTELEELIRTVVEPNASDDAPWNIGFLDDRNTNRNEYTQSILGSAGTKIAQTWHGYTLDDIEPTTKLTTIAEFSGDEFENAFNAATENERVGAFEACSVYADPEASWLEIETVGGPASTSILGLSTDGDTGLHLFSATSEREANRLGWKDNRITSLLDEQANLRITADLSALLAEYEAYSSARASMGQFSESEANERFNNIARLRDRARSIRNVEIIATHHAQEITTKLTVRTIP